MARKNIFELLSEKYNIVKEMNKIAELFLSIEITATNPLNFQSGIYSIEQIFEWNCFPKWKQRGPYLSCAEMKADLNIPNSFSNNMDDIIKGLEYYINILRLVTVNFSRNLNISYPSAYPMLLKNIDILLEHLNYEEQVFAQDEKVILVPKNPAATAVAEITDKEHIAFAILKYNHNSLKGNIAEKKSLLLSIANEYEPLLKNPINGFSDYFDKANCLLNNLNLRHNNLEGRDKREIVCEMPAEELEKWYDELYQLLLFCVLIKDNIKRKKEIDDLVKKLINL
ncbi:hypothetical protein [Candidatus Avelusimicrobium fimicolum]|jgi:hypothetical protein|uniref:hypothetical protein n=1 Tax=Candidatus Avelusimicrobium fimicolum TaxID=3416216 RepID=UPI003D0E81C9